MTISTMDNIVAALSTVQRKPFWKATQSATASTYHSLWKAAGFPEAGANPGSLAGVIPTSSTTGAFSFSNGSQSYLLQGSASSTVIGKIILYDRIWHNSEMSGTVTVDTTLGSVPSLTRPDSTTGNNELWAEVYTAIGSTAATLTVKYTNQSGTTGQSATYVKSGAHVAGRMYPLTLATGDTGVRKCTSYSWNTTTGTAGNFGLTLLRRIAEFPVTLASTGCSLDFAGLAMPQIYDSACLAFFVQTNSSTSTTGDYQGILNIGQG